MIKGVVLTNFMSYENSYVPLQSGLNLICGPNGAGKSSILLAISLVLGQAYTERSKRLSDLIRWGTEEARVTLILDNSGEKKPFPHFHTELVTVTRVIRKNGTYYYLLQNKPVSKTTVTDVFQSRGLNPDNILVIMHQFMVGRFAAVTPLDKLKMLEEAVGFQSYREEVLDARKRLESVMSEEQSLVQVLESTKETHDFWKREYERYLQKQQLANKLEALKHELLWSRIQKKRDALTHIETRIESKTRALGSIEEKIQELAESKKKRQEKYDELNLGRIGLEDERVELVKQITTQESNIDWATNLLNQFEHLEFTASPTPSDVDTGNLEKFKLSWKETAEQAQKRLERGKEKMAAVSERIVDVSGRLEDALTRLIDTNVEYEVSGFKRKLLTEEVADLQAQLRLAKEELDPMIASAAQGGEPNAPHRKIFDIMLEIGAVEEQMKPLASLSEDVERMYSSYAKVYEDLKAKADEVALSRQEVMTELDKRLSRWRDVLSNFLEELTGRYAEILKAVSATGAIRLISARDIEKCGLEILVGYKGNKPSALDAFTQSGGERSIAMMAFLLALQQHITSPFRAIDEFDVHMDPKNRESVTQLIMTNAAAMTEGQYLAITPGQINVTNQSHVIIVQNVGGTSLVSELK
jgi:structural maintenance of chromosomes protein 5